MERLGILTGADLYAQSLAFLQAHFGSYAEYLFRAARGIDDRPVRANRVAKSVGAERTFETNLTSAEDLRAALHRVADAAWLRIERHGTRGRTITLKLRHADFRTITRARSSASAVTDKTAFLEAGLELLMAQLPTPEGVRLLGLTLSGIMGDEDEVQPSLL